MPPPPHLSGNFLGKVWFPSLRVGRLVCFCVVLCRVNMASCFDLLASKGRELVGLGGKRCENVKRLRQPVLNALYKSMVRPWCVDRTFSKRRSDRVGGRAEKGRQTDERAGAPSL